MYYFFLLVIDLAFTNLNSLRSSIFQDPKSKLSFKEFNEKLHALKEKDIPGTLIDLKGNKKISSLEGYEAHLKFGSKSTIQTIDQMPIYQQYIRNLISEFLSFIDYKKTLSVKTQTQINTVSHWCLYILFILQKRKKIKSFTGAERSCLNIIRFTSLLLKNANQKQSTQFIVPVKGIKEFLSCFFKTIQHPDKLNQELIRVLHANQHTPILHALYTGNIRSVLDDIKFYEIPIFPHQKQYNKRLKSLKKYQNSCNGLLHDDLLFYIADYLPPKDLYSFFIATYQQLKKNKKNSKKLLAYYELFKKPILKWQHKLGRLADVKSINFSPCRRYIFIVLKSRVILLNFETGQIKWESKECCEWHWHLVFECFSRCGQYVITSQHRYIQLWNIESGKIEWESEEELNSVISALSFSPCRRYVVVILNFKVIKLLNVKNGQNEWISEKCTFDQVMNHIRVTKLKSSERVKFNNIDDSLHNRNNLFAAERGTIIKAAKFSSSGKYVILIFEDKKLMILNLDTRQNIRINEQHSGVRTTIFSPCEQYAISESKNNTIKFWNLKTMQCIWSDDDNQIWLHTVSFSSCGRYFLTLSRCNRLELWDINNKQCIRTLGKSSYWQRIELPKFSPCGQYIALYYDRSVRLWEILPIEEDMSQFLPELIQLH